MTHERQHQHQCVSQVSRSSVGCLLSGATEATTEAYGEIIGPSFFQPSSASEGRRQDGLLGPQQKARRVVGLPSLLLGEQSDVQHMSDVQPNRGAQL